ncbi:MAG: Uma2 family endonuclease [Cytophagales bacterium]|jgi:Uma2 family endonuclease|nr:Uma2 family endonuclease [Cytophagales bacterium]
METIVLKDEFTSRLTDEQFFWFCQQNKDQRIERNSNHEIIIMSPVTSRSGNHSGEIFRQLANWSVSNGKGIHFDSSTGFTLPDKSVFSPDASWISNDSWNALTEEDKDRFAPVCPDFVIEVRSKTDSLDDLKMKMELWLQNGSQLAWLIDPREKTSYLYHPKKSVEIIKGLDKKLIGEGPVSGFVLDLSLLRF